MFGNIGCGEIRHKVYREFLKPYDPLLPNHSGTQIENNAPMNDRHVSVTSRHARTPHSPPIPQVEIAIRLFSLSLTHSSYNCPQMNSLHINTCLANWDKLTQGMVQGVKRVEPTHQVRFHPLAPNNIPGTIRVTPKVTTTWDATWLALQTLPPLSKIVTPTGTYAVSILLIYSHRNHMNPHHTFGSTRQTCGSTRQTCSSTWQTLGDIWQTCGSIPHTLGVTHTRPGKVSRKRWTGWSDQRLSEAAASETSQLLQNFWSSRDKHASMKINDTELSLYTTVLPWDQLVTLPDQPNLSEEEYLQYFYTRIMSDLNLYVTLSVNDPDTKTTRIAMIRPNNNLPTYGLFIKTQAKTHASEIVNPLRWTAARREVHCSEEEPLDILVKTLPWLTRLYNMDRPDRPGFGVRFSPLYFDTFPNHETFFDDMSPTTLYHPTRLEQKTPPFESWYHPALTQSQLTDETKTRSFQPVDPLTMYSLKWHNPQANSEKILHAELLAHFTANCNMTQLIRSTFPQISIQETVKQGYKYPLTLPYLRTAQLQFPPQLSEDLINYTLTFLGARLENLRMNVSQWTQSFSALYFTWAKDRARQKIITQEHDVLTQARDVLTQANDVLTQDRDDVEMATDVQATLPSFGMQPSVPSSGMHPTGAFSEVHSERGLLRMQAHETSVELQATLPSFGMQAHETTVDLQTTLPSFGMHPTGAFSEVQPSVPSSGMHPTGAFSEVHSERGLLRMQAHETSVELQATLPSFGMHPTGAFSEVQPSVPSSGMHPTGAFSEVQPSVPSSGMQNTTEGSIPTSLRGPHIQNVTRTVTRTLPEDHRAWTQEQRAVLWSELATDYTDYKPIQNRPKLRGILLQIQYDKWSMESNLPKIMKYETPEAQNTVGMELEFLVVDETPTHTLKYKPH